MCIELSHRKYQYIGFLTQLLLYQLIDKIQLISTFCKEKVVPSNHQFGKRYLCFEVNVLPNVEFVRIQVKVLENVFIMHVDWEFLGYWVVAVTHHFLTGVDDC